MLELLSNATFELRSFWFDVGRMNLISNLRNENHSNASKKHWIVMILQKVFVNMFFHYVFDTSWIYKSTHFYSAYSHWYCLSSYDVYSNFSFTQSVCVACLLQTSKHRTVSEPNTRLRWSVVDSKAKIVYWSITLFFLSKEITTFPLQGFWKCAVTCKKTF